MRNFFRSPLFRCLVCLILVCCILVNVSPIRSEAFAGAVTAVVGTTAAAVVVASAFQALGVMPDSNQTSVFEGYVNDCVSALTASGTFVNGLVSVLQLSDGVIVKNHVNQGIIQSILDWLFAEKVVSETPSITWSHDTFECSFGDTSYSLKAYKNSPAGGIPVVFRREFSSNNQVFHGIYLVFLSQYGYYINDKYYSSSSLGNYFGGYVAQKGVWLSSSSSSSPDPWETISVSGCVDLGIFYGNDATFNAAIAAYDFANLAGVVGGVAVASGLVAGQIGTDVETDYKTWVEEGVISVGFGIGYVDDPNTHDDDDEDGEDDGNTEIGPTVPPGELDTPVEPSPSPSPWWKNNKWLNLNTYDYIGMGAGALTGLTMQLLKNTQTETQVGTSDPLVKVDTSLFGNGGNGTNTVTPPDIDDPDVSDPTTPSDPSTPSDIAGYTFDLTKIFPFCIPFDLYDFLTCLDATPVAPVINWEIQLPGGSTYPLTVDLSAFDSVAQLLRRLELLVFSIALAIKTRDLIKG